MIGGKESASWGAGKAGQDWNVIILLCTNLFNITAAFFQSIYFNLFIWLHQVSAVVLGSLIFLAARHVGSSSLTRNQTPALGAQSLSQQAEREVPHKFLMAGFLVEKREKTDFQIRVWCATARMKLQELRRRGREMLKSETVGRAFWVLRLCPQLYVPSLWGLGCIGFHWDEVRCWVRNCIVRTPCSITLWGNP